MIQIPWAARRPRLEKPARRPYRGRALNLLTNSSDDLHPTHIRPQHFWNQNRPIGLLVVFQDGDHHSRQGQAAGVQGVNVARPAAVDRSILRLGSYELLAVPERSAALVINEAVVLARRFGTDDSPRFVNGVLSSVASEVRPE